MTVLLEKRRLIVSPGLAPTQLRREDKFGHPQHADVDLTIGLSGHTGPGQLHPGVLVREGAS